MQIKSRPSGFPRHYLEDDNGTKYFLEVLPPLSLLEREVIVNVWSLDSCFQKKKIYNFNVHKAFENEVLLWFQALEVLVGNNILTVPPLRKDYKVTVKKEVGASSFKAYGQPEVHYRMDFIDGIPLSGNDITAITMDNFHMYRHLKSFLHYVSHSEECKTGIVVSKKPISELQMVIPLVLDGLLSVQDINRTKTDAIYHEEISLSL